MHLSARWTLGFSLLAAVGGGFLPACAAQRVTLASGSHLEATAYRMVGNLIVFSLAGGGEVGVPPSNVLRIEEQASAPVTDPQQTHPPRTAAAPAAPAPAGVSELPRVSPFDPEPGVRALIARIARDQKVDPRLVEAMVKVESNFDPFAVSSKGAMGLMQLMPKTARRYQVGNTFDPVENLRGGTRYIKELMERYGEIRLALAAYNAGEEAVDRYGGVPPFRETREYVVRILRLLDS